MKKLQITRSLPNYEKLVELYKTEKNAKQKVRYHALVLMHEFKNCMKVAEIIKMSDRSVQSWIKSFNKDGLEGIALNSPPGRPSSLSQDQLDELKQDVLTHPRELNYEFSNWDGKAVSEHIKNKFDVDLKVRRCQYILHELELSLQRPRYDFPKADPEEQEKFIEDFKKNSPLLDQTA